MMNHALYKMMEGFTGRIQLDFYQILYYFSNSFILGTILTLFSVYTYSQLNPNELKKDVSKVLGITNILFLCVGLTGVLMLVNNNFTRALSIGATLALIRFRINVGKKGLVSNLLFGVLAGVACGLGELTVAWLATGIYVFMKLILVFVLKKYYPHSLQDPKEKRKDNDDVEF